MTKYLGLILVGGMLAFGVGCDSSSSNGGTGGLDPNPCQAAGGSGSVEITVEEITEDTVFEAACTYILTRETYVMGAEITIEPGTEFQGDKRSALIITTTGRIEAAGTEADPIVFTSSALAEEAKPGDWGGMVLLGLAKLSWGDTGCDGTMGECQGSIEGISPDNPRGKFGGNDDSHDCGTLQYVRIEYAGAVFGDDNELNGLTVGGCGSDTTLDHIQVHRGLDDGVEFFGGTAPISYVIVTGTGDDGIDWDQGYRGSVDYFIVHHFASTTSSPNGIEADNYGDGEDRNVQPRSAPDVVNGTVIGDGRPEGSGIVTRVGTWAGIDGVAVVGFGGAGYDMRDGAWSVTGGWPDGIVVENSCFDANGENYPDDDNDPKDATAPAMAADFFDEPTLLADEARNNFEADPGIGDVSAACTGEGTPNYALTNDNCAGAFGGPGGTDWTTGWTSFPTGIFDTGTCP